MAYLIIMLICVSVYYRTIKYGTVVDDDYFRAHSKQYTYKNIVSRLHYLIKGLHPVKDLKLDHAITIAIHTIVCMLIYSAFGYLSASLLFAVNLSNNQVSIWLNGKRYGANTIVCLLAYIFAPYGIVLWLMTPFFQPSAIMFPLVLALKGYWWLGLIIPVGIVIGNGYIIKWAKFRAGMIPVKELKTWNIRKIPFILKTYAFYFFRGIFPMAPMLYISYLGRYGFTNDKTEEAYKIDFIAVIGAIIVIFIPLLYLGYPKIMFGFMWWLIMISLFNNWITITVPFGERYMYLPNVGLMLGLSELLNLIHPFAWFFVFGVYLGRLVVYTPMYRNMNIWLKHHTYTNPLCEMAWVYRVNESNVKNDVSASLRIVDEGLENCPDSPRLWLHKSAISKSLGNQTIANNCIARAKENCSGDFGKLFLKKIEQVEKEIINK